MPTGTRLLHSAGAAGDASEPRPESLLKRLQIHDADPEVHGEVAVPPEWADKFGGGSIALLDRRDHFEEVGQTWAMARYRASLKSEEYPSVVFEVGDTQCPRVQRAVHVNRRLRMLQGLVPMSNLCFSYEAEIFEHTSFLLRPHYDTSLLSMLRMFHKQDEKWYTWFPPAKTLQLVLDILRGLRSLEEAGVMHFDLSPANVVFNGTRAYIANFGSACVEHGGDREFSAECFGDSEAQLVGSALRHAPEMTEGRPTGPKNGVWAVGLILGELLLGDQPTEKWMSWGGFEDREMHERMAMVRYLDGPLLRQVAGEMLHFLDLGVYGRQLIRNAIAKEFDIEESLPDDFGGLKPEMQHLLRGMLELDEDTRWTVTEASKEVEKTMSASGFEVLDAVPPLQLPSSWFGVAP